MGLPEFRGWGKTPRFEGLQIEITEKIDGTNGCVIILSDDSGRRHVHAASRKRIVTPEADNYGFAAWVAERAAVLADTLGPGYWYGEFWGEKIQRTYGLDRRRFSLFTPQAEWRESWPAALADADIYGVPVLYRGPYTPGTPDRVFRELQETGSCAAPGWPHPEGVVIRYLLPGNPREKLTYTGPKWKAKKVGEGGTWNASIEQLG